jgi:hypothetical protein
MTVTHLSEAERARRSEFVLESRAALAQGKTLEQRTKTREEMADKWAQWFRHKMDARGCTDPVEVLPDAFAKLEQTIDDRVIAAIKEIKAALRGALK